MSLTSPHPVLHFCSSAQIKALATPITLPKFLQLIQSSSVAKIGNNHLPLMIPEPSVSILPSYNSLLFSNIITSFLEQMNQSCTFNSVHIPSIEIRPSLQFTIPGPLFPTPKILSSHTSSLTLVTVSASAENHPLLVNLESPSLFFLAILTPTLDSFLFVASHQERFQHNNFNFSKDFSCNNGSLLREDFTLPSIYSSLLDDASFFPLLRQSSSLHHPL